MSFPNRIQIYDAERGLPRRADEPYLPAYNAFLRCMQDAGQVSITLACGALSAVFLWFASLYFGVGFYAQIIYVGLMLMVLAIACAESSQVLLPYYRFNQLLTYGTAQWASPLYLQGANFARSVNEPLERGELEIGKLPRALRKPFRFVITPETALGSLVFFGPPRSGKSVLLMNYLRCLALSGWSSVIIDPKGELFEYCARYFNRVYRLDFQNPECSDRWNFILNCKGNKEYAHMMATIMLGIEGTKHSGTDPFWSEAEVALLTAILLYVPTIVDRPTPAMIHEFIALRSYDQLCDELANSESHDIQVQWGTFTKAPDQTRGSVFTGLAAKINPFTIDAAKAVTASILLREYKAGARYIDFEELREPGTAIFIVIPEGAAARYKIPLATFMGQAVEHLRAGVVDERTTPVMFVVDEAAHVPLVNLKEIPGVGRGRRFAVMLFYQNLSQGFDMYGEHGFNAILGSVNTKTFLPGCDLVTARYASELVGQTTVWGRGFDDAPGTWNDKSRTTEAGRSLIDPAEVRQLPVHLQAVTIIETMPPVRWTFPKSAKTGVRALPRKYGQPHIINFTEAERQTSERRFAASEQLKLPSGAIGNGVGDELSPALANVQTTSAKSECAEDTRRDEAMRNDTSEPVVISKVVTEHVIKEKTRKSMDHLMTLFDSPPQPQQATSPMAVPVVHAAETTLERILNP
ncbi:MAG: type IV secretory system conjugative DNA transfer family protein [Acidobacteriota bacterium]|nr:type IV secretory system conjugative DNA transfer family protein [Acidobacteriota bacterium]